MFDSNLQKTLENLLHPVTVDLDAQGRLLAWDGDPSWYGLDLANMKNGEASEEFLPMLIGLDLSQHQTLPLVNLPGGHVADVIIQPDDSGNSRVILLESREKMENIRDIQQQNNETALLYQRLQSLSDALRKTNAELEHALDARNQFISGVSHEFRTPITTIIGHCELLSSRCESADAALHQSFHAIDKNAKFLLALIDNLLEQGEISANRLEIKPVPVEMSQFFQFIVDMFHVAAAEKQLELNYHEHLDQSLTLLIDEHYLYLVLVNLITNALKFTDEGHVDVIADWKDDTLSVVVADSGIGIPESALEKILEPFSRADNVAGRRGSGLGLSIVKEVVAAMKGDMNISSKQGEGTRITLTIPAPQQQSTYPKSQSANATQHSDAPVVMIVEDDNDIASLYKIILNDAGMKPICFVDGQGFVDNIATTAPDIIVLDYNLGDENGLDLAKKARASGYRGPVVLFTATSAITSHLEQHAREAGCTRLSQKPRDVTNLAAIIKSELAGNQR